MSSPQYPQVGTSVLQSPVSLTPGACNSAPNNAPYGISPVSTYPYQVG